MTLRVVELFAGIGAQRMALTLAGIPYEVVAISEIDRHSLASYEAIYGDCPNLGDIRQVGSLPGCDLVTYSFPCQDLSIAGKQRGMAEGSGTRSALVWEVMRLLDSAEERPEWLLMENVPLVLSKKNLPEFQRVVGRLAGMGYSSKYALLDSSMFGSAQKRVRAFMVSRLGAEPPDLPEGTGDPPRCIRDVMVPERPERFVKRIPLDRIKWRDPPESDSPIRVFGCLDGEGGLDRGILPSRTFRNRRVYEAEGMAPACVVKSDSHIAVVGSPGTSTPVAEVEGVVYYPERVLYSAAGSAPTVCTDHGNNRLKVVAEVDDARQWRMWNVILDPGSVSPCVPGRLNSKGTSIKVVADLDRPGVYEQCNRVYSAGECCPSIPAATNTGNRSIKIVAEDTRYGFGPYRRIYSPDDCAPTFYPEHSNRIRIAEEDATSDGGSPAECPSPADPSSHAMRSQARGPQDRPESAYLTDGGDLVVWVLTPRECWRLMGFPDWAYDRASEVCSETQLYNQAGNSIVTQVLAAIFRGMFFPSEKGVRQATLNSFLPEVSK